MVRKEIFHVVLFSNFLENTLSFQRKCHKSELMLFSPAKVQVALMDFTKNLSLFFNHSLERLENGIVLCFIVGAILRCNSFLMVQEYNPNSLLVLDCSDSISGIQRFPFQVPLLCYFFSVKIEVLIMVSRCGFLAVSEN